MDVVNIVHKIFMIHLRLGVLALGIYVLSSVMARPGKQLPDGGKRCW